LLLLAIIATISFKLNSESQSFSSFSHRPKEYYTNVADGCDKLLTFAFQGSNSLKRTFSGSDEFLPNAIKSIRAKFIEVETNRVYISVGNGGRAAYAIIWEQNENSLLWQLSGVSENYRLVLFTRSEPVQANQSTGSANGK